VLLPSTEETTMENQIDNRRAVIDELEGPLSKENLADKRALIEGLMSAGIGAAQTAERARAALKLWRACAPRHTWSGASLLTIDDILGWHVWAETSARHAREATALSTLVERASDAVTELAERLSLEGMPWFRWVQYCAMAVKITRDADGRWGIRVCRVDELAKREAPLDMAHAQQP
jgi:hypothetical protein